MPYYNCIFAGFDESGNAAYASYRSTPGERLMGEAAGSDRNTPGKWAESNSETRLLMII